jgi:maleylacetoacetate isomerase
MNEFILYNYFRSSASYRVRIALNLKGIQYEYRAVHLTQNGGEQKSTEYTQLNPSAQVPTLVHRGRALGQSMAIIQYLDEIIAEPAFFPKDPFEKARVIQACEIINSGIQPLHNLETLQELKSRAHFDHEQNTDWTAHFIRKGLRALENFLVTTAGNYCFGHELSAADIFLAPQAFAAARNGVALDEFPVIARVVKNYDAVSAFKAASPDAQPDTPKA